MIRPLPSILFVALLVLIPASFVHAQGVNVGGIVPAPIETPGTSGSPVATPAPSSAPGSAAATGQQTQPLPTLSPSSTATATPPTVRNWWWFGIGFASASILWLVVFIWRRRRQSAKLK